MTTAKKEYQEPRLKMLFVDEALMAAASTTVPVIDPEEESDEAAKGIELFEQDF